MNRISQGNNDSAGREGPLAAEGARGTPDPRPGRRRTNVSRFWIALVAFVVLAVVAGGVAMFVKRLADQHMQAREDARNAPKDTAATTTGHDFGIDRERVAREKAEAARQASLALPVPAGAMGTAGMSGPQSAGAMQPAVGTGPIAVAPVGGTGAGRTPVAVARDTGPTVESVADRRLDGDVLVKFSDAHGAGSTSHGGATPVSTSTAAGSRAAPGGLDDRLTPSMLASARAAHLPDLSYLLKRGTIIRCVTRTKIVTTYPGMTSCTVSTDIYSADGKTLLVERGSEATGEQRTALMQGQGRIFVLWSRIDMPDGVTVDVNSPGADSLGASGHEAFVDTHFWQRFGGAMMVSLVGDFGQALASRSIGGNNNQINLSSTSSSTQSLADETLKNTINIPPTAYTNQGSEISIYVARDIDFRSVYELASR